MSCDRRERVFGMLCRVLPMTLLMALVVSWFVWGPFGAIFYAGGLFNSLLVFVLSPFLFLLIPAAVICLPVLAMRTISRWSVLGVSGKGWRVLAVIVCLAFPGSFVLGFAALMPSPFDMFVRGFARYVELRVDVAAIQGWLGTLDPNDYKDSEGGWIEGRLADSEPPQVIANLHPKRTQPMFDQRGRLAVRLLWGGGMIGHWGIVVGPADMPMSASDSRLLYYPLAPGAYIWSGD